MPTLRACFSALCMLVACSDPGVASTANGVGDGQAFADGGVLETSAADAKASEVAADATAEAGADVGADLDATTGHDALADVAFDLEALGEVGADAGADILLDAGADLDAAFDAGSETMADAVADPGPDTGGDSGSDATSDSGSASGTDVGSDAGSDSGAVSDIGSDAAADSGSGSDSSAGPDAAQDTAADIAAEVSAADATAEVVAEIPPGCADSTREGFLDKKKFPLVAACAGAWDIPGIHKGNPACGRKAGNTGVNAPGKGCNVEDLCADGWHVCYGAKDLKERNPEGCGGILDGGGMSPAFFLARTSSTGAFNCSQDSTKFGDPGTSNDLFGCGDLGCGIDFKTYPSCDPLNRASHDLCKGLRNDLGCGDWCSHLGKFPAQKNTWDCGKNAPTNEANLVVKSDPLVQGGVLCCVDFITKP